MNWLIRSSVNPEKYALTIKGLGTFIPSVLFFLALGGIHNVEAEGLQGILDGFAMVVTAFLTLVSALLSLWGLVRKVFVAIGWWGTPPAL